MSTTIAKNRATRRTRSAAPAPDAPAPDAQIADIQTADTPANDDPAGDAQAPDIPAVDGATVDARPADAPTGDVGPAGAALGGSGDRAEGGEDVTWADAVPWLALQMGGRPTMAEVAFAVPVWQMLHAAPGATALRLAADAETTGLMIDPVVMGRVLARYQRVGIVRADQDGPVVRWSPISPASIVEQAKTAMTSDSATSGPRAGRVTGIGSARPAGELRTSVAGFLAEHPYQDWSPAQIAKALDRSGGATANALERLVAEGTAVQTSPRPRRYQHATGPDVTDPHGTDPGSANPDLDTEAGADSDPGAVESPAGEE